MELVAARGLVAVQAEAAAALADDAGGPGATMLDRSVAHSTMRLSDRRVVCNSAVACEVTGGSVLVADVGGCCSPFPLPFPPFICWSYHFLVFVCPTEQSFVL